MPKQQLAPRAAGGEPFSYQSVTVQQRMPIVLQGEFTFVRGLLSDPDPPQFTARVRFCQSQSVLRWCRRKQVSRIW